MRVSITKPAALRLSKALSRRYSGENVPLTLTAAKTLIANAFGYSSLREIEKTSTDTTASLDHSASDKIRDVVAPRLAALVAAARGKTVSDEEVASTREFLAAAISWTQGGSETAPFKYQTLLAIERQLYSAGIRPDAFNEALACALLNAVFQSKRECGNLRELTELSAIGMLTEGVHIKAETTETVGHLIVNILRRRLVNATRAAKDGNVHDVADLLEHAHALPAPSLLPVARQWINDVYGDDERAPVTALYSKQERYMRPDRATDIEDGLRRWKPGKILCDRDDLSIWSALSRGRSHEGITHREIEAVLRDKGRAIGHLAGQLVTFSRPADDETFAFAMDSFGTSQDAVANKILSVDPNLFLWNRRPSMLIVDSWRIVEDAKGHGAGSRFLFEVLDELTKFRKTLVNVVFDCWPSQFVVPVVSPGPADLCRDYRRTHDRLIKHVNDHLFHYAYERNAPGWRIMSLTGRRIPSLPHLVRDQVQSFVTGLAM